MKSTILIIALTGLLFNFHFKAQTHTINMAGDNIAYPYGYLSNGDYYIKDINNNLDDFAGTWEYVCKSPYLLDRIKPSLFVKL